VGQTSPEDLLGILCMTFFIEKNLFMEKSSKIKLQGNHLPLFAAIGLPFMPFENMSKDTIKDNYSVALCSSSCNRQTRFSQS